MSIIVIVPLMLSISGCFNIEISDEKGKEWTEKNGYVKNEESSVIGAYNFEYVSFGDEDGTGYRINSCVALSGLQANSTITETQTACQDRASTRIEITENGLFKVIEPSGNIVWKYLINEKGELLVSPLETDEESSTIEGVYYNIDTYKLENGRVYLNNLTLDGGIEVVGVYKK